MLHVAIYILCNNNLIKKYFHVSKKFIKKFVTKSQTVYDKFFVVYNIYSLLHICDDVQRYGTLEDFSCFRFENHLGKIKRSIRGKNLPLAQVHHRIVEFSKIINNTPQYKSRSFYIPCGITNKSNNESFFVAN